VGRVELPRQAVHIVGEQAAVQIQRHLDARVTELRLDGLRVGALGDQKGRTSVSDIVDAQIARQVQRPHGLLPDPLPELEFLSSPPSRSVKKKESGPSSAWPNRCSARRSPRKRGMTTVRRW
jgi:hypothetical protein